MVCGFINDGYTLNGYLKEAPGIHPAVRFKYRPLTVEGRIRLFDGWSALPALDQISRTTTMLAKQISQWDLKDAKGGAVSSAEPRNFRRLPPLLHERLLEVIGGISPPDPDPEANAEASDDDYADKSAEGNSSAG
jgi:hypothetical protein